LPRTRSRGLLNWLPSYLPRPIGSLPQAADDQPLTHIVVGYGTLRPKIVRVRDAGAGCVGEGLSDGVGSQGGKAPREASLNLRLEGVVNRAAERRRLARDRRVL